MSRDIVGITENVEETMTRGKLATIKALTTSIFCACHLKKYIINWHYGLRDTYKIQRRNCK